LTAPLELFSHDVYYLGEGFEGGLGIEKGQSHASSENINGRLGVLVSNSISNFAINKWIELRDAFTAGGKALVSQLAK
jgi:hypothetical protein